MHLRSILVFATLLITQNAVATDVCESKFLAAGIKPGTKDCEIRCATLPVDMGTFNCSMACEDFCKTYLKPETVGDLVRFIEPRALTPEEKSLVAKYPLEAMKVYRAKKEALNSTRRIFGDNFRNDESDAFRHFVWAGMLREQVGKDLASAFLNAHEASSMAPQTETKMDQLNNAKGVDAATKLKNEKKFSEEALERAALQSIKNGDLNVLSPSGKVPEWKK